MARFRKLDALAVAGKRVLVRVDLNVPMQDGKVTDTYRIERLVSTVKFLTERDAKVVLMSHFGRPKNGYSAENSLFQLMDTLSAALGGKPIAFATDCIGPIAEEVVAALAPGDIALLENLRFHPGEEANDPVFAAALAKFGDFYVNDAFSVSHRAHTSTAGLAALLPSAAGLLMQAELEALGAALDHPQRPVVALVGGSKVSTKIDLLNSLVTKVDCLVIGGAMANTLLLAQGISVGKSLAEADRIDTAHEILATAEKCGCQILLPTDAVVADKLAVGVATEIVPIHQVPADKMILDVGPATVAAILARIAQSKTLVWNGPVGAFEFPPFDAATVAIARGVADRVKAGSLLAVAGGGDTVAALAHAGVIEDLSYVSTAGGAFLEWLEGRVLPGVKALDIA